MDQKYSRVEERVAAFKEVLDKLAVRPGDDHKDITRAAKDLVATKYFFYN